MKLSERLEIHAKDVSQAANPNDDMVLGYYQLSELAEALTEASALAKRYEDAPVRMVGESTSYSASVAGTGIKNGQRVRIVLDKEG